MGGAVLRLKIQGFANNEIRVTRAVDKFVPKSLADNAGSRREHRQHRQLEAGLEAQRTITRVTELFPVKASASTWDAIQHNLLGSPDIINPSKVEYIYPPVSFPAVERGADGRFHSVQVPLDPLHRAVTASERIHRAKDIRSIQKSKDGVWRLQKTPLVTIGEGVQAPLGIMQKSQRRLEAHPSHGREQSPKSFTRAARHHLLECGAVIDRLGLKDASSLLTLTLPGSQKGAYDALARWSGWIVNRQLQAVRRYMKNRPVYWFFVWEWQQRGALHQHWCVTGANYEESRHLSMLIKDQWYKCLKEISCKENIDMFAHSSGRYTWVRKPHKWNWNEQKVEKSVARYFSKYASKEAPGSSETSKRKHSNVFYPSRWHGSSSAIKKVIREWRFTAEFEFLSPGLALHLENIILKEIYAFEVAKAYWYDFKIEGDGGVIFAQGECKIHYISDSEFAVARSSIVEWIGSPTERLTGQAPLQWAGNFWRDGEADRTGSTYFHHSRLGLPVLSR